MFAMLAKFHQTVWGYMRLAISKKLSSECMYGLCHRSPWMRSFKGSQCSSYINGVIWLKCGAQQTGLAALFKTRWTFICQYSKSILKLIPKRIDIFSKIFSKTSCLKARFIDISSPVSHFGSIFDQQLLFDHKQPRIWPLEITVKNSG